MIGGLAAVLLGVILHIVGISTYSWKVYCYSFSFSFELSYTVAVADVEYCYMWHLWGACKYVNTIVNKDSDVVVNCYEWGEEEDGQKIWFDAPDEATGILFQMSADETIIIHTLHDLTISIIMITALTRMAFRYQ